MVEVKEGVYGINNCTDLLRKAHYDFKKCQSNINPYDIFNLACTLYHIVDWVESDDRIPQEVRKDSKSVRNQPEIRCMRGLCNKSKHFKLTKCPNPQMNIDGGWGGFNWGEREWGSSPTYLVEMNGSDIDLMLVAEKALSLLDQFMQKHRLME